MSEKTYTFVFTSRELDAIYDALEEMKHSVDSEEESATIGSIQDHINAVCLESQ